MSDTATQYGRYGLIKPGDGSDVRSLPTLSIDLRAEFGHPGPDETAYLPPGTVARALFPPTPGEGLVGEVRLVVAGQEIRLVAALTGRQGVVEMTPEMLRCVEKDPTYRGQWTAYLGLS